MWLVVAYIKWKLDVYYIQLFSSFRLRGAAHQWASIDQLSWRTWLCGINVILNVVLNLYSCSRTLLLHDYPIWMVWLKKCWIRWQTTTIVPTSRRRMLQQRERAPDASFAVSTRSPKVPSWIVSSSSSSQTTSKRGLMSWVSKPLCDYLCLKENVTVYVLLKTHE